jgi:hypothetical protein
MSGPAPEPGGLADHRSAAGPASGSGLIWETHDSERRRNGDGRYPASATGGGVMADTRCLPAQPDVMSERWPHESVQSFGPYDSTVPTARARTRAVLTEWGLLDVAKAAELVLSELLTNALQATWRFRLQTPVGVRLVADSSWLVVEVWDCVQAVPVLRVPDIAQELTDDESDGHGCQRQRTADRRDDMPPMGLLPPP